MNELLKRRSVALMLSAALVAVPVSTMAGDSSDMGGEVGDGTSVATESMDKFPDSNYMLPTYTRYDVDRGSDYPSIPSLCSPDPCVENVN